jgi:hypothetical protein
MKKLHKKKKSALERVRSFFAVKHRCYAFANNRWPNSTNQTRSSQPITIPEGMVTSTALGVIIVCGVSRLVLLRTCNRVCCFGRLFDNGVLGVAKQVRLLANGRQHKEDYCAKNANERGNPAEKYAQGQNGKRAQCG